MTNRNKGSAWVKQLKRQVDKFGEKAAPWYVEWNEPDGTRRCKSCGTGASGRKIAKDLRDKLQSEMTLGTYKDNEGTRTTWEQFVERYQRDALAGCRASSVVEVLNSLAHFARVLKLKGKPIAFITTRSVDEFKGKRRLEPGKKPAKVEAIETDGEIIVEGSDVTKPKKRKAGDPRAVLSAATLNKELRHIKAALRKAAKWGYLEKAPDVEFLPEDEKFARYLTEEHFALIFGKCELATTPEDQPFHPSDWWRALLTLTYLTGWRIGETLALKWSDVNFDTGVATTRAETNKGRKDAIISIPRPVLSFLEPLRGFREDVFGWDHDRKRLQKQFDAIQTAAGIALPCNIRTEHQCTAACHRYTFHDLRRGFATNNADRLTAEVLQRLMRHASYQTTQGYIKFAKAVKPTMIDVFVPDVLKLPPPENSGRNGVGTADAV